MAHIVVENSIILPCSRPQAYYLATVRKVHYLNGDREGPTPEFVDCVQDRSWTEMLETPSASFKYSYVVYPVADSTRMTVTAEIGPKRMGKMFAGLSAGSVRKREKARMAEVKKAILAHMGEGTRLASTVAARPGSGETEQRGRGRG